ncbi:MAG: PepSY-like domain-containing protein [Candidatus Pseudobacter hemicellulosilyticus]|uniref:PepSY-like domain-containing protein n=1 Tax=Candidatus Pseudobacter hemicellulosilyticus TaxID=3121375 RepID=A0AAJ6BIU6_9BACT|nr:MAG: PepSY-like domain-containing protein [Pseudobacter sp.]
MKKLISLSLLIAALFVAQNTLMAQLRKVPAAVTDAFKQKYPSASSVEWRDKVTYFVAGFSDNGTHYDARFTSKGEWKDTETEIGADGIPAAVKDGLSKSKYADWEAHTAYEIQLPGDKKEYRVHVVKSDLQKKNLLFNSSGKLLKDNITL